MNRTSLAAVRDTAGSGPAPLRPASVLAAQAAGAFVLDVRRHEAFAAGHLAGAVNVGIGRRFEQVCRDLVPPGVELVCVGEPRDVAEAVDRLDRLGLGPAIGTAGTVPATARSPRPARASRSAGPVQLLDVRADALGHTGVVPIPLADLLGRLGELRPDGPTAVLDSDGYRSSAAASLLRACGFAEVSELIGDAADALATTGQPRLRLLASA